MRPIIQERSSAGDREIPALALLSAYNSIQVRHRTAAGPARDQEVVFLGVGPWMLQGITSSECFACWTMGIGSRSVGVEGSEFDEKGSN